jgi:uncharacterized protein (DUF433 family)
VIDQSGLDTDAKRTQSIKGVIMKSRIDIHPDICNGRPIIAGTRIPVQTIMEFLGAGDSVDEVLEEYPSLKRKDIYACIQFATTLMANHYEIQKIA